MTDLSSHVRQLQRWLRQGGWREAASQLDNLIDGRGTPGNAYAAEWGCDGYVDLTDGEFMLRVKPAEARVRRRKIPKGTLVVHIDDDIVASELGCYAIRPLRKPGPRKLPDSERRRARTVYFTDTEWQACGLADDRGASAFVRTQAVAELAGKGLL